MVELRTLCTLIFGIFLYCILGSFLHIPSYWFGVVLILCCFFWPGRRVHILAIGSPFYGLYLSHSMFSELRFGHFLDSPSFIVFGSEFAPEVPIGWIVCGAFLAYLVFVKLLMILHHRFFRYFSFKSTSLLTLVILVLTYLASGNSAMTPNTARFFFGVFVIIVLKHFWYILLALRYPLVQGQPILEFVSSSSLPFWTQTPESREMFSLSRYYSRTDQAPATIQRGVKALIFSAVSLLVLCALKYLSMFAIYGAWPGWQDMNDVHNHLYGALRNIEDFSRMQAWSFTFGLPFIHILEAFFVWGQFLVGTARLCGVGMHDYVDRPWLAESFAGFFSRTMYFYNIAIYHNFYIPIYRSLKPFSIARRWHTTLSLSIAIVVGGYFFHLFRFSEAIFKFGLWPAMVGTAWFILPYLAILAVFICISVQRKHAVDSDYLTVRLLIKFLFHICAYALILVGVFAPEYGGLPGLMMLYKRLIGL